MDKDHVTIMHIKYIGGDTMSKWMTMKNASKELRVSQSKISRLAKQKKIETKDDPLDSRVSLVDVDEIRKLFELHNQLLGKSSVQDKDPSEQVEDTL